MLEECKITYKRDLTTDRIAGKFSLVFKFFLETIQNMSVHVFNLQIYQKGDSGIGVFL